MGWPTWYQHASCMYHSSSWSRTKMLRQFSYPPDFWGPWHHNCVGDGGGQSDERGDVDGAAGPFWFNSILSWRQISLQTESRASLMILSNRYDMQKKEGINHNSVPGLTGRLQGLLLTFTHRLGGKWSSCGQLVSDKQNLEIYINADVIVYTRIGFICWLVLQCEYLNWRLTNDWSKSY